MTDFNQYQVISTLKIKNSNKRTILLENRENSKKYVAKLFSPNNNLSYIAWMREKSVNFQHANICNLVDYGELDKYNFVLREFINGTDWNQFYKSSKLNKKGKLKFIVQQTIQVLEALNVLHKNKVIHRDIRPENILIENDSAKLIDFESAKCETLREIDKYNTFTFVYSAPEQVLKIKDLVNETSDIFALGMTLWVIFNGKLPFMHRIPEVIANLQVTYPISIYKNIPKPLRPIIEKAIQKYKFERPPLKIPIDERKEMLQQAQSLRYQSADEMIKDLLIIND